MTRYMIYFEPLEVDANNLDDAKRYYKINKKFADFEYPKILKIIPTEFLFDIEPKKEKIA